MKILFMVPGYPVLMYFQLEQRSRVGFRQVLETQHTEESRYDWWRGVFGEFAFPSHSSRQRRGSPSSEIFGIDKQLPGFISAEPIIIVTS